MKIDWKSFAKRFTPEKSTFPVGTVLFTGAQGKGKSISAVHYLVELHRKYPTLKAYSNIELDYDWCEYLTVDQITERLISRNLTEDGDLQPVAFFIDEIQNVLFSKTSKVSFDVLRAIAQQRKTRKTIIGTLQEFLDLDVRYRRQLSFVVRCHRLGNIEIERWLDGQTLVFDREANKYSGQLYETKIWKFNDEIANSYDTFAVIGQSLDFDASKMTGSSPG